jgi:hypothetical protein
MNTWQWLTQNSGPLQSIAALLGAALTALTIAVLCVTWGAIRRGALASEAQAESARALTLLAKEQTEVARQQTEVIAKQSVAALEQVAVAKRQITESVRPILTVRLIHRIQITPESFDLSLKVTNEGAGVALDVWWMYGRPGIEPNQRNRVEEGIIPPGVERFLQVPEPITAQEGVLIVYESLSGITSGTRFEWKGQDAALTYYPEINDWGNSLIGRVLGSAPSR